MSNSFLQLDDDYLRALRIGEVAFSYYQIQRAAPTKQEYTEWLSKLPILLHNHYKTLGFEEGKDSLDFRKYFLGIRRREMKCFMQENLCEEDFNLWEEMRDNPDTL